MTPAAFDAEPLAGGPAIGKAGAVPCDKAPTR
jgi:hypothetical protein